MAEIKPGTGSAAIVPLAPAPLRQLDGKREPDELITPERLDDKPRVARWLTQLLRDVESLKRRWAPRRIDHEDRKVDATGGDGLNATKFRFAHGFGGRVRWWVTDWQGVAAPALVLDTATSGTGTDANTLVLRSYVTGTVTIRIEEAG